MRCYGNHPLTLPILFTKGDSRDTQTIHMEIGSNGQTAPDTCSALDTDFSNITSTQFLDIIVRGGNCRKIDGNSDGFSGVAANIDRLAARGKFSQKSIQRVAQRRTGQNIVLLCALMLSKNCVFSNSMEKRKVFLV